MKTFKALVILSGGMDSTICLAQAIKDHGKENVAAISFDYGQRHRTELDAAIKIVGDLEITLHKVISLDFLGSVTSNALLNHDEDVTGRNEKGEVKTLVVGRNGLFLRIAAMFAHSTGAEELYIGINELDAINYRDCSRDYMDKIQDLLRVDLGNERFTIKTPISMMTKKETMKKAYDLSILSYALKNTVTCYNGIPVEGCGKCLACELRAEGLQEFLKENPEVNL